MFDSPLYCYDLHFCCKSEEDGSNYFLPLCTHSAELKVATPGMCKADPSQAQAGYPDTISCFYSSTKKKSFTLKLIFVVTSDWSPNWVLRGTSTDKRE